MYRSSASHPNIEIAKAINWQIAVAFGTIFSAHANCGKWLPRTERLTFYLVWGDSLVKIAEG